MIKTNLTLSIIDAARELAEDVRTLKRRPPSLEEITRVIRKRWDQIDRLEDGMPASFKNVKHIKTRKRSNST